MKEFNRELKNGHAYRKQFPSASSQEMAHYCIPTLKKDSPDTVIIHTGKNVLRNREDEEIINNIMDIVEICETNGVNNIYVSAITFREQFNEKASSINNVLWRRHPIYNFTFIENTNISREHIWKDKIHLNTINIANIANNFINTLNKRFSDWLAPVSLQPSLTIRDDFPDLNTLLTTDLLLEKEQTIPLKILKDIKLKNVNRLVIGQLNINSFRNILIKDNIDIFVVTESKLDSSFPSQQFSMDGYIQFRADRNAGGGGVLVYVRQDILCGEINCHSLEKNFERMFLEINLGKTKWLIFGGYNNMKTNINAFLRNLGPVLDHNMYRLENFLLIGDFNSEITEIELKDFCVTYNLENLVIGPTWFKKPAIRGEIKLFFPKQTPSLIRYRCYYKFNSNNFWTIWKF